MERHVKERLVGAAVLMAAAIILVPEMLSGPDRPESEPTRPAADEAAVKTYTIDLNRPPGTPQEPAVAEETLAPPPERDQPLAGEQGAPPQPVPSSATETNPESDIDTVAPRMASSPTVESAQRPAMPAEVPKSASQPVPAPPTSQQSTPRSLASEPSVPNTRGWAVQLGSFSSRASAERLAAEFRAEQYEAFVMPVQSGGSTLYRVRIGPIPDRASADQTLRRVRSKVAGAAVVAHP